MEALRIFAPLVLLLIHRLLLRTTWIRSTTGNGRARLPSRTTRTILVCYRCLTSGFDVETILGNYTLYRLYCMGIEGPLRHSAAEVVVSAANTEPVAPVATSTPQ